MARKKLKPPTSRARRRGKGGNTGWYTAIGLIVVLGVTGIVLSREGESGTGVVDEIVMPDLGGAETISVSKVLHEPFDRVEKGDPLFMVAAGDAEEEIDAPKDGFVVQINVAEGDTVPAGTTIGTFQTGPDFAPTNAAGNHWHTAYGVNVCGQWLPPVGETTGDFHSHGDGLIHAHPRSSSAAGTKATAGLWFERQGGSLSSDVVRYPGGERYESGEVDCDGEKGVLRWAVNGEERTGNPGALVVGNGDVLAIAFVPEGADLPTTPPSMNYMAENYVPPKHPDFVPPAEEPAPEESAPEDSTTTTEPSGGAAEE